MARAKKAPAASNSKTDFSKIADTIVETPIQSEIESSFLRYAYMVIAGRAIPDVRDGMKPVQRRILWSMLEAGNTPEKKHSKSAQTVGAVMGNYHPHGDSAIYDALVRLAQKFNMRMPLIDPKGNFGSAPGDSAAASRYTEAKLAAAAMQLLADIKEDSVAMKPNYSAERLEPTILPTRVPNILINGGSGIAVGFATNLAPHNPTEIMDAALYLLKHPTASTEKLLTIVPGPDFPAGGMILGIDAIKQAYETGRGIIRMRARAKIEDLGRGRKRIVFKELPYGVSVENIIEKIAAGIAKGQLQSLSDMKDLSDRENGICLAVDLKAGSNVELAIAELYKTTPLEESFGINNVVIHEGRPVTMGLKRLLQIFLEHRVDVVKNRSAYRVQKKEARAHLLTGLLKALANIDAVIKIIRGSDNVQIARESLIKKYKIDEIQANYILAIPLSQLTKYDQIKLEEEKKQLQEEIKALNLIITDEKVLQDVIAKELTETKKLIADERRSEIIGVTLAQAQEEAKQIVATANTEIEDAPCYITLNLKGNLVQSAKPSTKANLASVLTSTRGKFIAVTNKGRGFRLDALHIGERETMPKDFLPESLTSGEKIITITPVALQDEKAQGGIAIGTKSGVVKICTPTWPKTLDDFLVISLENGDEILAARWVENSADYDFAFITTASNILRFEAKSVRPSGLTAGGVAGIKLSEDAVALAFGIVPKTELPMYQFSTVTDKSIKTSRLEEIPTKGRATQGMRGHTFRKGEEALVLASIAPMGTLYTKQGKSVILPPVTKRDASGTPLENPELF